MYLAIATGVLLLVSSWAIDPYDFWEEFPLISLLGVMYATLYWVVGFGLLALGSLIAATPLSQDREVMTNDERPLIYREWWVFPFLLTLVIAPWPMAASVVGDHSDLPRAWPLFLGPFALALVLAVLVSVKLDRARRLFPTTKAQANENRARTLRSRSYWPFWIGIALAIRLGPAWLQLVGLGLLSGVMATFTVVVFINAVRKPPT